MAILHVTTLQVSQIPLLLHFIPHTLFQTLYLKKESIITLVQDLRPDTLARHVMNCPHEWA
jgi:hypothetical protein